MTDQERTTRMVEAETVVAVLRGRAQTDRLVAEILRSATLEAVLIEANQDASDYATDGPNVTLVDETTGDEGVD